MIEIPEWLAKLPKNAMLDSKEFSLAIGVSYSALAERRKKGFVDFPPCDCYVNGGVTRSGRPFKKRPRWKAVTVRNYIRHLNRKEIEDES